MTRTRVCVCLMCVCLVCVQATPKHDELAAVIGRLNALAEARGEFKDGIAAVSSYACVWGKARARQMPWDPTQHGAVLLCVRVVLLYVAGWGCCV